MPAWRWATQGLFDQLIKNYRNVTYNAQFSSLPILFGFVAPQPACGCKRHWYLFSDFGFQRSSGLSLPRWQIFVPQNGCVDLLFGTENFGERTAVLSTAPVMRDGESSRTILVVN